MPSTSAPRVLVVAEFAPGAGGGGWIILKQLLRGYDWNQVYWWSFFKDEAPSYHFGGRHHSCNVSSRLSPNRRLTGLKGWILENIVTPYAARDLLSFVRSVKPDFILFVAHRWGIPVVYRVMPQLKTHWHVAVHDMPDTSSCVCTLGQERASRFVEYTDELYRNASSQAVISPAMAEHFRARTGVECYNIFRCAVEPEIMEELLEPKPQPKDDVIRIGYAGTIIADSTFARFVKALAVVRQRLDRKVEIHLYSWHSYKNRDWFDASLIIEHGSKSDDEIHALYRQLTWGLAIMHLEDIDLAYNRMSFPCKFTAALAAGLPLICLGHRESALIQLAKNYRLGLLLTDADSETLVDKLCEGLNDTSSFDAFTSERVRCAKAEFNARRNREKMHELIGVREIVQDSTAGSIPGATGVTRS